MHNYLFYRGELGTARAFPNEGGPVLTLAARRSGPALDAAGRLTNVAAKVPPVVHQYDRWRSLLRWAAARHLSPPQRVWLEFALAKQWLLAR